MNPNTTTRQETFNLLGDIGKRVAEIGGGSLSGGTDTELGTTVGSYTPTVVSSSAITDRKIPELTSKAAKLPGGLLAEKESDNGFDYDSLSLTGRKNDTFGDPLLRSQMELLDKQKQSLDSSAQRQITSVTDRINSLMSEQRAINEANTAGVRGALMSGGGAAGGAFRFSPGGAFGGVANEATAGVRALADLASREAETIANIKSAQDANNFKLMETEFSMLDQIRQERQAQVASVNETAKKMETQNLIASAISEGFTDPVSIFQQLGGEVGFDDILAITKEMPQANTEQFTLGSNDIRFDAQGNVIARGAKVGGGTGSVLAGNSLSVGNPVTSVGAPVVQGLGVSYESSSNEAQLLIDDIVNGLPTQLINNVAEIPRWRESVRKQLAAGYTPQQVVDKLSGFRIFDATKQPLADVFYNLAIGSDLEPGDLAALMNRGANEQAMTTVENAQLKNASGFFSGTDKARATIKQADTVLSILNDPEFPIDKLGAFDGRVFKVNRFAGLNDKQTKKIQQLESALQLLNAPIRVEIVGTAATEAEMAKITGFQADILSQPEIVKAQVESLRDAVLAFHNEARAQRGLPTVDRNQVIDNLKRLELYRGLSKENSAINMQSLSNNDLLGSILDPKNYNPSSTNNTDFWTNLDK